MKESITFEELLLRDGSFCYTNVGVSMLPLLRERRDIMRIEAIRSPLKKWDVVLFVRPHVEGRGHYVLHRILRVNGDGTYWIVGDNCTSGELVREEHILGILTGIQRKGKPLDFSSPGYRLYVRLWCAPYPLRFLILRGKHFARRCLSFAYRKLFRR